MGEDGPAPGCPGCAVLESVAAGSCDDPDVLDHLNRCDTCRANLIEIKDNRRFLADMVRPTPGRPVETPGTRPRADLVPGYEIADELGRGGQAVVYKAVQLATRRKVALKMSAGPVIHDGRERLRFDNEITLVASLRHPFVVTVYDSGVTPDGRFYIAMEYIRGLRLDEWARRIGDETGRRSTGLRAKLGLMMKVCDAVQSAHTRGIIHRDLKPSNILVDSEDNPRLLDFGVARTTLRVGEHPTLTGQFAGTPAYASPEQVAGSPDQIDTRTDVYSLGVVLFEVVTGRLPYPAVGSLHSVLSRIATAEPDFRGDGTGPALDEELQTILRKAMAKERERRYQTAGALGADVRHYLAGEAIDARRDSTLYVLRKTVLKHRGVLAISTAAAAVIVVVTTTLLVMLSAKNIELTAKNDALVAGNRDLRLSVGRMRTILGQTSLAEEAVWPVLLAAAGNDLSRVRDPGAAARSPPDLMRAWWALAELYARQPCLASWPTPARLLKVRAGDRLGPGFLAMTADGRASFWRLGQDEPAETWAAPAGKLGSRPPVWSDDASRLLCGDEESIWVLDTRSGAELSRAADPGRRMGGGSLSPDGRELVSVGSDGRLTIYHADSLKVKMVAEGRFEPGYKAFMSDDKQWVIAVATTGRMTLVDASSGKTVRTAGIRPEFPDGKPSLGGYPRITRFAPDGRHQVAVVGGGAYIWCSDGVDDRVRVFSAPDLPTISTSELSRDGRRLAIGTWNAQVQLWDIKEERMIGQFGGIAAPIAGIVWGNDTIATSIAEVGLRVWELEPGRWLNWRWLPMSSINSARYTASGNGIICCGRDGTVRLLGPGLADAGPIMTGHVGTAASAAASADGARAVSTGHDGTMRVWDCRTGNQLDEFRHPDGPAPAAQRHFTNIVVSGDGRTAAAGGRDGRLWVWTIGADGRIESATDRPAHTGRLVTTAISDEAGLLATTGADGRCVLWSWPEVREIRALEVKGRPQVRTAGFRPGGKELVTGDDAGRVVVWDTRTGAVRAAWSAGVQHIFGIAVHVDGVLVATGDRAGAVKLWDSRTGVLLATLIDAGPDVFGLSFSPDGQSLAFSTGAGQDPSGKQGAQVGVWSLTYYARHISGNAAFWAGRGGPDASAARAGGG